MRLARGLAGRLVIASVVLQAAAAVQASQASEKAERWMASSNTALSITGHVSFSPRRIGFQNGKSLGLADAQPVPAFADGSEKFEATVYRVAQPAAVVLKNGNPLCGSRGHALAVTYIAVWKPEPLPGDKAPRAMAAYSGSERPQASGGPGACGVFYYGATR